jgi:hypothetical protein
MALDYADQKQDVGAITVANPAAAVTVTLGWQPRYIRAYNVNNLVAYEWFEGMSAGTSLDNGNHADTQNSVNAAGSITASATGFTLGLDICDTAADVVRWLALR